MAHTAPQKKEVPYQCTGCFFIPLYYLLRFFKLCSLTSRQRTPWSFKKVFHIYFSLEGIPVVSRFVAWNVEMDQLRQEFLSISTNEARRKVAVLHGLGGIGKTQLSVELAWKHHSNYRGTAQSSRSTARPKNDWSNALLTLPDDCHRIKFWRKAEAIYMRRARALRSLWERSSDGHPCHQTNDQWLLTFDNVERDYSASFGGAEAFDLKEYFPKADPGSLFINFSTREPTVAENRYEIRAGWWIAGVTYSQ